MKYLNFIMLAMLPFFVYAGNSSSKRIQSPPRAYIVESIPDHLACEIQLVANSNEVAMTDVEFCSWLQDWERDQGENQHAREYFERYKKSGTLRKICYVYVPGFQAQTITLEAILHRVRDTKERKRIIKALMVHDYSKMDAKRYCPGPDGGVIQDEIISDVNERTEAILAHFIENNNSKWCSCWK